MLLLVAAGAWARWSGQSRFMGTVDDLLAPLAMAEAARFYPAEHLVSMAENTKDSAFYYTRTAGLLRKANAVGLGSLAATVVSWYHRGARVSKASTYAPLQYWLTAPFVSGAEQPEMLLYKVRLPSLLLGLGAVLLLFMLLRQYLEETWIAGLTALFVAMSWEQLLMHRQSFSYAIGLFGVMVLLHVLHSMQQGMKRQDPGLLFKVVVGITLGLCAMAQYQLLFFWPAVWVVILFAQPRKAGWLPNALLWLPALVISIVLFYPVYKEFLAQNAGRGIMWNKGMNGEYLFAPGLEQGTVNRLLFVVRFFTLNTLEVAGIQVASWSYSQWSLWLTGAMVVLPAGYGYLLLWKDPAKRWLAVFGLVTFMVWMLLAVMRSISWSPSRHSIILAPLFLVPWAVAMQHVWSLVAEKLSFRALVWPALTAIYLLVSVMGVQAMVHSRSRLFGSEQINALLLKHDLKHWLVYGWEMQPFLYWGAEKDGKPYHIQFLPSITDSTPAIVQSDTLPAKLLLMGKAQLKGDWQEKIYKHLAKLKPIGADTSFQADGFTVFGPQPFTAYYQKMTQAYAAAPKPEHTKWQVTDSITASYGWHSEYKPFALQPEGAYWYVVERVR